MDGINNAVAMDKLLILYIIKKSNFKITYFQLSNLVLEYELINYFDFVEYFNELKATNFFENSTSNELVLSDFSIQILDLLEDKIDPALKKTIDDIFNTKGLGTTLGQFQIIPVDGNNVIKLTLNKEPDKNFSLEFTVSKDDDIKAIEENWLNKNKSLYTQIIKIIKD